MFRSPKPIAHNFPCGAIARNVINPPKRLLIPDTSPYASPIVRRSFARATRVPLTERQHVLRRRFRSLAYFAIFGSLGYGIGNALSAFLADPAAPGSLEDTQRVDHLRRVMDRLEVVKQLRADPDYVEWEAYDSFSEEEKPHRLTSGPLSGSRNLPVQRIFWNEKKHIATTVVHMGIGLSSWPSIVHGGAVATVLDESFGRVAIRSFPARTGVTANLNIDYIRPLKVMGFYIVTVECDLEKSTERKAFVKGEIRDSKGRLCATGNAIFVVPKTVTLRPLGDNF
ncbi:thioesterase [Histoplasma capsulatum G186AR]|uniref:Thioesterase n=2 Tax=Ajellomyces capsulatus TaxID=5037 RepID=C0NRH9_AJECG|nr:thioesterase [Histoplasma capsulatum G186AR]EEH06293.1 thioesterase [Histoplasma capsulatum G186AR]KAG5293252.1 thioesterase [Histoplasma capsulatum]QSS74702.1 thioesterase [Histoplasma capsulatum G186AR]